MFSSEMPIADRISTLPDKVLCHILSFLQTKQVVTTSVLSKRWMYLWHSVPTLHFDDKHYFSWVNSNKYFRFINLVYTVIVLRDVTQSIKKFSLRCKCYRCKSHVVNTWLKTVMQGKVEDVKLFLHSKVKLQPNYLTSSTLVVLKLKGMSMDKAMNHLSVGFPSLKTLHMIKICFPDDGCVVQFLSACPILEDLHIKSLNIKNCLAGESPELQEFSKLIKADISNTKIQIRLKSLCNVEFLRYHVDYPPICLKNYTFLNLTHMELFFRSYKWRWLIELLHSCPYLRSLVIEMWQWFKGNLMSDLPLCFWYERWVDPEIVPKCLLSQLHVCCVERFCGSDDDLLFARYIMQNARVLRTLTIRNIGTSDPQEKLQMIEKLSLCSRSSEKCELVFL